MQESDGSGNVRLERLVRRRRKTFIKFVGVGDNGRFIFWDSLANSRLECRAKIIKSIYPIPDDPCDWSRWEIREVEIKV